MDFFPFTKDIQAFLLRATASLERIDGAVAEVHVLVRNANGAVNDFRSLLDRVQGIDSKAITRSE